jgi:hypothetical protein
MDYGEGQQLANQDGGATPWEIALVALLLRRILGKPDTQTTLE